MPQAYKVLGQSNPSATTATTLYTVPASTSAVVSSITVANLAATATTFRLAVRPAGATLANQHYIAYDATLPANDTTILTLGLSLATTDIVTVYAGSGNVAFSLFGTEIT
jgi:glucose-6-phosphate dehydrogenase assembly protein OpcA